MPFSTTIWPPPAQSTWPTSRTPFAELMMLASFLELNAIGTLQGQHLPCFRRRRHLIAELLDDAANLRHLLGVARRKLAGADVERVLKPDAHIAAQHRGRAAEIELVATARQHRPQIIVAEQPVGGSLHEHEIVHVGADAAE